MALQWVDLNGLDVVMTYIWERLALKADKADLTTAVRFMGSVPTYAELPTSGNQTGDMWNVEEDGSNYCWTANGTWDDLSGIIDLSAYYTIAESEAAFVMLQGNQTVNGIKTFTGRINLTAETYNILTIKNPNRDLNAGTQNHGQGVYFYDGTDKQCGFIYSIGSAATASAPVTSTMQMSATIPGAEGDTKYSTMRVTVGADGSAFASCPTPLNKGENSTMIATTAWVNTASSVVHKTGNETIDGEKIFSGGMKITAGDQRGVVITRTDKALGDAWFRCRWDRTFDSNGLLVGDDLTTCDENWTVHNIGAYNRLSDGTSVSAVIGVKANKDGTVVAIAPATRATGYGSLDIATAGWVDSKLAAVVATAVTQEQIDAIVARLDALEAAS